MTITNRYEYPSVCLISCLIRLCPLFLSPTHQLSLSINRPRLESRPATNSILSYLFWSLCCEHNKRSFAGRNFFNSRAGSQAATSTNNTTMQSAISNATMLPLPPLPTYTLTPLQPLLSWIPDLYLALILPVAAYWITSFIFHFIDEWDLFPQYRLHTPAEVLKRNHVSRWDVFRDVIIQQIVQTAVGLAITIIEPEATIGQDDHNVAVWAQRIRIAQRAIPTVLAFTGLDASTIASKQALAHPVLAAALNGGSYNLYQQAASGDLVPAFASWELTVAKAIYWIGIPALQFTFAVLVVDTWQYFLHRAMHMNKWLYTTFHSRHHRLYVPYAYGALYNHPFEGFLLDTLGTGIAYMLAGMTCRQSMWFFTCSTIKTVDDHCGYALPWDPLQHITSNNAGYHDIHHQSWGIKTNFSQPFFTFWDGLLGTKWVGGDVSARYERSRIAAQKKLDQDNISQSNPSQSLEAELSPYESEEKNASTLAKQAQAQLDPNIPEGKAALQALGSRQQILDDQAGGGVQVLVEEAAEEREAQRVLRRSPRKKTVSQASSAPLKGLRDRVNTSLHGKASGVLVESSR
jgi:sphinganine C4-monooxygenase